MRRLLLFFCGIALLSAAPLSAQESPLPKQFHNWKLTSCVAKPVIPTMWKETGMREFSACQFKAGDKVVGISGGRYHDSSSAFEAYTNELRNGMVPTNLGQVSAFDKDGVLMLEGSLVLASTANISKEDLGELVKAIEASSEKAPLPPIRTYLPGAGRMLGSERYALGPEGMRAALGELGQSDMAGLVDAAGFNSGAEAMLARYSNGGKDGGVLLLLEYPTPQLAEQHIHHLDEVLPAAAKQAGTVIERKGSLLSMVLSPSSVEYAKKLRTAVDYETQVTWNEASQVATDPPITSTLVKIIMATGVFMVAAIVLGIAFGGVRVVTKRLFPGRVFDRANQMEVLQLGLSGKRIDPSDFY
ncbi:MAG: DUF6599 family protein [Candidatus Acidiferrum sp.]